MSGTTPQPFTNDDELACERVLHSLLALTAVSPLDQCDHPCAASHLFTNNFNFRSLDWNPSGVREIGSRESCGDTVTLCFLSHDVYPFRVTLIQEDGLCWRIRTFQGGCPVCFADGIHEEKPCTFCDGTGYHTDPVYGPFPTQ